MCRFLAYLGEPALLDDIIIKPVNSLLTQSLHARESQMPTNGDGFGLAWYQPEVNASPGLFRSVFPAWNDKNLTHLASKIKSPCFLAHVRAASHGEVSHANCHPFIFDNFSFMHNGGVGNFKLVKRHLCELLDDDIYHTIKGETDSEHLFALFLQNLRLEKEPLLAFKKTLTDILLLVEVYGDDATSYLNLCLTDGKAMMASRITSDKNLEARSLHYATGESFVHQDSGFMMQKGKVNKTIIIASEKLTENDSDWLDVPVNHLLKVDERLNCELLSLSL